MTTCTFIVAQLVIMLGWYFGHFFNSRRDRANAKRDKVIDFRIEAYRSLERGMARDRTPMNREEMDQMEKAIAEIQIFGNEDEIDEALEFTRTSNAGKETDVRPLLALLRKNLREELGLVNDNKEANEIVHWRLIAQRLRPLQ